MISCKITRLHLKLLHGIVFLLSFYVRLIITSVELNKLPKKIQEFYTFPYLYVFSYIHEV